MTHREDKVSQFLLEIKDLKTYFYSPDGIIKAVDGVSLSVDRGNIIGIAGESGCGKSVTALSIMRILQMPPAKIVSGNIYFKGEDLLRLPEEQMRRIRGAQISMVFQEPMTSLNPVLTIGYQIAESIRTHLKASKKESMQRVVETLRAVGMPSPEERINEYPHQMSGGMRQRAMIAMALSCNPLLLIADEPTTALDVTIQAQILELLNTIRAKYGTSIIIITHDLGIIAEVTDRVAIMYAGRIVEKASTEEIFLNPKHPYTIGLLESIPKKQDTRLRPIPGTIPNPLELPVGCKFRPRCIYSIDICEEEPSPSVVREGHIVRCYRWKEIGT